MTIHIGATKGEVASTVLLPGDPLRAKYAAETFLEHPVLYNEVRGMLGYTGIYHGERVSIQGSGMGQPSLAIYMNELVRNYDVDRLIRIGSCGSIQPEVKVRDIILCMGATTHTTINKKKFGGMDFAPTASFPLLLKSWNTASRLGLPVHVGGVLSTDTFYADDPESWKLWAAFGVLALEMETSALYSLAAQFKVEALTVLTVSDSLVTGETTTSEERQSSFGDMIRIALEAAVS
jgi:purine-nucleoside phosphorylase